MRFRLAGVLLPLLLCAGCVDPRVPRAELPVVHGRQLSWVLRHPQHRWVAADTPRFHLHAVEGSVAAARLPELGVRAERLLDANLALLDVDEYPRRLELAFLRSREDMRGLLGSTPGGFAITMEDAALVVINEAGRGPMAHELMHVLSWQLWGQPFGGYDGGAWISEGVATDAMHGCMGRSFDSLAAGLLQRDALPSVTALTTSFDHSRLESSVAAASFVRFVRERHGTGALRQLWQQGPGAAGAAAGMPLAELEARWREALATVPPDAIDPAVVRQHGCEVD